jgi:sugar lactone lactonase YvrE
MNTRRKNSVLHAAFMAAVAGIRLFQSANALCQETHIYWFDSTPNIWRANLDGSHPFRPIYGELFGDVTADPRTATIYWTSDRGVVRSNLDGTNETTLFSFPSQFYTAGDIAIDPIRNNLYFSDSRNNIIYRSNIDGSAPTVIVPSSGVSRVNKGITDICLDPVAQKIYWNFDSTFHRANLDGSQVEDLFTASTNIGDFEIDPRYGQIYWSSGGETARGSGSVRRANLDGSAQQTLISGLWDSAGLAIDFIHNQLYFADGADRLTFDYDATINVADLDGSNIRTILDNNAATFGARGIQEIGLDTFFVPEPSTAALLVTGCIACLAVARRKPASQDRL